MLLRRDALPIAPHIRYGVFRQVVRKPGARVEFPLFHERHCGSSGYRLGLGIQPKNCVALNGKAVFDVAHSVAAVRRFFAVLDNQDICTGCVAVMYRFLNSGKYFFLHDTITPLRFDLSANISYHKSAIFTRAFKKHPEPKTRFRQLDIPRSQKYQCNPEKYLRSKRKLTRNIFHEL